MVWRNKEQAKGAGDRRKGSSPPGGDPGVSIIHSSGGDTINSLSDSVKCSKKKKVGEVCVLGVGVIDIILYRQIICTCSRKF